MKLRPFTKLLDSRPEDTSATKRSLLALIDWIRDLTIKLLDLSFEDNFQSYTWEGTIAAGATTKVIHGLGSIPSGRIIYKCVGGIIQDGTTAPTDQVWYLKNVSSTSSATATVIIFK